MVKLYAPADCFTFFGIFQEYSMEYSIFQKNEYFGCFMFFLEYSWNIPYSKIFQIFVVDDFFWNIPYSTKPRKNLLQTKIGILNMWYFTFQKPIFNNSIGIFWNKQTYSIFQKIYNLTSWDIILEYSWNIPYSKNFQKIAVAAFYWNIPFF